ncbi:hypothetical protein L6164_027736 [Bauhinia variegata]|uniref:Uncharacterized protein n=1 Tax=Bauhinia variegata TaxID=167791 RepID=A0ACB9LUC9_BAUVA|nr:hypothetical protein L6164_027736 [Bauhinia variegata]
MAPVVLSKLFRDAITRRQGVTRSLYSFSLPLLNSTVSEGAYYFSSGTSKTKSTAVPVSKAVADDVYACDTFTSCITKPKGSTARRPKPLTGFLCFGHSTIRRPCINNFSASSSACYSTGAAHDVSCEEEELANSSISIDRSSLCGGKKLISGSCCLPHPDKEETGGEDAHFICNDGQAIGLADGVSSWADVGVDAGEYARELMSNSIRAILEEPEGSINLTRVLEKAHSSTKAKGSSTACIITLTEEGLRAINLGDSGFLVISQNGRTIFRSPIQQHSFFVTYQLESDIRGDLPSSGEVFTIPVSPGDVVIAGTDGLFDNLYKNDIINIVVSAIRAGLKPQATAERIATLARQRALDKNRQTPFSIAAQNAGIRYYGGKPDDITVVVSYITTSNSSISFSQLSLYV